MVSERQGKVLNIHINLFLALQILRFGVVQPGRLWYEYAILPPIGHLSYSSITRILARVRDRY